MSHILVTARIGDRVADLHDVYQVMLHEMGQGLGLLGHSPDPGDAMFESLSGRTEARPSARDRATLTELYRLPIGRRIVGGRQVD